MEETSRPRLGHIVEYNEDGTLVRDFNDAGKLDAPWGMAIAPAGFGPFGGALLVANLGDGTIAALISAPAILSTSAGRAGKEITIERIWGLMFGNGVSLGDAHALYFTAGRMENSTASLES